MNVNQTAARELSLSVRTKIRELAFTPDDFAADVHRGLTSAPKTLSPRYFYDPLGSVLFDAICNLPEYYVARVEEDIITVRSADIVRAVGARIRLAELGSGTARKTRHVIKSLLQRQETLTYIPIDIERDALVECARAL